MPVLIFIFGGRRHVNDVYLPYRAKLSDVPVIRFWKPHLYVLGRSYLEIVSVFQTLSCGLVCLSLLTLEMITSRLNFQPVNDLHPKMGKWGSSQGENTLLIVLTGLIRSCSCLNCIQRKLACNLWKTISPKFCPDCAVLDEWCLIYLRPQEDDFMKSIKSRLIVGQVCLYPNFFFQRML